MKHITCELPLKFTSKQGSYWKLKNYRLFWGTCELCGLEIGYLAAVSAVGVTYLACIWYSIKLQAQHSLGCPREKRRFEKSSALSTESKWRTIDLKRLKIWDRDGSASFCRIRIPFNSKQMKKLIQKTSLRKFFICCPKILKTYDTFDTNDKDKDFKVAMLWLKFQKKEIFPTCVMPWVGSTWGSALWC